MGTPFNDQWRLPRWSDTSDQVPPMSASGPQCSGKQRVAASREGVAPCPRTTRAQTAVRNVSIARSALNNRMCQSNLTCASGAPDWGRVSRKS
jgi:hypothetical protein